MLNYVTPEDIKKMQEATIQLLEKTGVRAKSQRFLDKAAEVGLRVEKKDGDDFGTIYFTKAQIDKALSTAPQKFSIYGLDDKYEIKWGERRGYSHTCVGTPFVEDLETGVRRNTTLQDLEDYVRIADALPATDIVSSLTVQDIPEHAANAIQVGAMLRNTYKPLRICIESAHETKDVVAVLSAAVGGLEALQKKPIAYLEVSPISPLDFANNPAEALLDIVDSGLPLGVIPCPMMGATGPMTLIGSVVMHNAEILAGVVIAQLVKPGHPTIMSPRVTFMNMSTILNLWAAPEMGIAAAISAQLIREYGLPSTIAGFSCASKTTDAQAGYEVMLNCLLPALVGVDVIGASGSLDNVLIASFEKLVVDDEICSLYKRAIDGNVVNENTMAVSVIDEVVNGERNFLAHEHTIEHLRSELWTPHITDRMPYDTWSREKQPISAKANKIAKDILANHKVTSLSPERLKAVNEAVENAIAQK